jgi:hypothetical protein
LVAIVNALEKLGDGAIEFSWPVDTPKVQQPSPLVIRLREPLVLADLNLKPEDNQSTSVKVRLIRDSTSGQFAIAEQDSTVAVSVSGGRVSIAPGALGQVAVTPEKAGDSVFSLAAEFSTGAVTETAALPRFEHHIDPRRPPQPERLLRWLMSQAPSWTIGALIAFAVEGLLIALARWRGVQLRLGSTQR